MDVNATVEIRLSWPKVIVFVSILLLGTWASYHSLEHPKGSLRIASWIMLCVCTPLGLFAFGRMVLLSNGPVIIVSPEGIYDRGRRKRIAWPEIESIQRRQGFRYRHLGVDVFLHPTGKNYLMPFSCHTIAISVLRIGAGELSELLNEYFASYGKSIKPSPAPQSTHRHPPD